MRRARPRYFLLEGRTPIPTDLETWAASLEPGASPSRTIAREQIGRSEVSTVFLGLDHGFGDGPPLLFETLVFGGPLDLECDRYSTYRQAEAGHAAMVRRLEMLRRLRRSK